MNVLAELVQPNWHIALIHFPFALLSIGLVMEVICGLLGAKGARDAGRWMILLGAALSLPVAISGLYALQDLAKGGEFVHWHAASALSPELWTELRTHALIQGAATAVSLLVATLFLALSDNSRRFLYPPLLLLMLLAVTASLVGSHIAGQAVYNFGLPRPTAAATSMPSDWPGRVAFVTPPLELHGLLAGLTISVGLIGLALALRNSAVLRTPAPSPKASPNAIFPGTGRGDQPRTPNFTSLPATRVLLLSSLLALLTAAAGMWYLSQQTQSTAPRELWETIVTFPPAEALKPENRDLLRRPAHIVLGSLLLTIPAVVGLWSLVRPSGRFLTIFLGTLFLSAAAAQLWVGTLLLWDLPIGPVTQFVQPSAESPQ